MEQLTKNQAVATSQEAVQNQNEPQLRDENAHNDKSVHGVLNPSYQAGLRRDRKSGAAGMPRPISYAVFCLKKKMKKCQPCNVITRRPIQNTSRSPASRPIRMYSLSQVHFRL